MIEYIKEYGVNDFDYEYIIKNINKDILDLLILSESSIRETLAYYNSIGLNESIGKIIIERPDLIIINKNTLSEIINKIGDSVFYNIVKTSIEDLIVLGI